MVNEEKTSKRDLSYSKVRRDYGIPMIDVDDLVSDYNMQPVAIMETKFARIKKIDLNDYQFTVLKNLAAMSKLPFFCVVYYPYRQGRLKDVNPFVPNGDRKINTIHLLDGSEPVDWLTHIQFYVIPINNIAKSILPVKTMMTEHDYVQLLYKLNEKVLRPYRELFDTWIDCQLPIVIE